MTELQKTYQTIQNLIELKVEIPEELIQKRVQLEFKEIVPLLCERMEPILCHLTSELDIVVKYRPDKPLWIEIGNQSAQLHPLELNKEKRSSKSTNEEYSKIRVRFPDGEVIEKKYGYEVLAAVIVKAGIEEVRELPIKVYKEPLISIEPRGKSRRMEIAEGLYMIKVTPMKKVEEVIHDISTRLSYPIVVEVKA